MGNRQESCKGVPGASVLVAWRTIGALYSYGTCFQVRVQSLPAKDKGCKVVAKQVTGALVLPTYEQGPRASHGNS
jgi:hypothetical protein